MFFHGDFTTGKKRRRCSLSPVTQTVDTSDLLDSLPDDLVISILSRLSSTSQCPSDFINVLMTCKRLNVLGTNPVVLSSVSSRVVAVKAQNWSESSERFLKRCVEAGSFEACYTLGMIQFYCLQNRRNGASLMAKAAISSHAPALYSLAVIQFNGSGGSKNDKDLKAGVALCARAAFLGHVDALRELGHCLQDGYGVPRNISEGRRFLVQANARELRAVLGIQNNARELRAVLSSGIQNNARELRAVLGIQNNARELRAVLSSGIQNNARELRAVLSSQPFSISNCPLLSDFGCNVPEPVTHPANRFLADWFVERGGDFSDDGLRLCSHDGCGRLETRKNEFRRCSICGIVNYCSRACQALDWKLRHKMDCAPVEILPEENVEGDVQIVGNVNGDHVLVPVS